jgi:hypothetical protein
MPAKVSLAEVVDALEAQMDESAAFLNRETGEIVSCTDEEISMVEREIDEEDLPEWQREMLPKVREALSGGPWLALPSKFDIHDWEIMSRFADAQENERNRRELQRAIHGTGAFRNFRHTIDLLGIPLKAWHNFHYQELEQIARDWLEENNIPYSTDPVRRKDLQ